MTDPRTPCTVCGAMILLATAARNDGLCMPCRNGTRQSIEEARVRNREIREAQGRFDDSPEGRYWRWLVDQVHRTESGLEGLSIADQRYYMVSVVSGEVWRGGIGTYFDSSSGAYYDGTLAGLEELGLVELRDVLKEAKMALFGDEAVPMDEGVRWQRMYGQHDQLPDGVEVLLDRLSQRFCDAEKSLGLSAVLQAYAEKHKLYAAF